MRCFVAMGIDDAIRARVQSVLANLQPLAAQAGVRISWARPSGWHITLKFLGEIAEDMLPRLRLALAPAVAGIGPFEADFAGLCGFPPAGPIRVLAVGVRDQGQTAALAERVNSALAPLGFERDDRAYVPHITVARLRDRGAARCARELSRDNGATDFGRMTMATVGLYESMLNRDGARYRSLAEFTLRPDRAKSNAVLPAG